MDYDKIKLYGDYILAKKDKKYRVYDAKGILLNDLEYDKIRLERNTLQGFINKKWENVEAI